MKTAGRRTSVFAALGCALATGLPLASGCSRPVAFSARNLLLVSVDALRADRLGCYGDPDARTPFWDRLAREGCEFRTMVSPASFTLPSHATMLSGAQPWEHGARDDGSASFSPPNPTLAEILSAAGMATGAFVGSDVLGKETGLARGFQEHDGPGARGSHERTGEQVLRSALQWMRARDPDTGFFLFVHLYDVHDPHPPALPWSRGMTDPYDAEIAATDGWLVRFLRDLETDGRLHRTMIIATADHGEPFDEPGEPGQRLATPRVPLVLWGPFPFRGGGIRPDVARTVDILPTALEALRVGTKANRPGRALQKRLKPYQEAKLAADAETYRAD